jgi:hypothetical protein
MNRHFRNEIIVIVSIVLVILNGPGCSHRLRYERQQAAIAKVKKLGGSVQIDKENPESPALTVSLMDRKVSDAELGFLKDLYGLETLDLRWTKINGQGLLHLKDMKSLKRLRLHHTPITDAGMKQIKELTSLIERAAGFVSYRYRDYRCRPKKSQPIAGAVAPVYKRYEYLRCRS